MGRCEGDEDQFFASEAIKLCPFLEARGTPHLE